MNGPVPAQRAGSKHVADLVPPAAAGRAQRSGPVFRLPVASAADEPHGVSTAKPQCLRAQQGTDTAVQAQQMIASVKAAQTSMGATPTPTAARYGAADTRAGGPTYTGDRRDDDEAAPAVGAGRRAAPSWKASLAAAPQPSQPASAQSRPMPDDAEGVRRRDGRTGPRTEAEGSAPSGAGHPPETQGRPPHEAEPPRVAQPQSAERGDLALATQPHVPPGHTAARAEAEQRREIEAEDRAPATDAGATQDAAATVTDDPPSTGKSREVPDEEAELAEAAETAPTIPVPGGMPDAAAPGLAIIPQTAEPGGAADPGKPICDDASAMVGELPPSAERGRPATRPGHGAALLVCTAGEGTALAGFSSFMPGVTAGAVPVPVLSDDGVPGAGAALPDPTAEAAALPSPSPAAEVPPEEAPLASTAEEARSADSSLPSRGTESARAPQAAESAFVDLLQHLGAAASPSDAGGPLSSRTAALAAAFQAQMMGAAPAPTANPGGSAPPAAMAQPPSPTASLPMPLAQLASADAMFDRLDFMLGGQVQQAEIELTPEHLGTIQVRIRMERDGADIRFAAASADTRQALEQSLPQLRAWFRVEGTPLLGLGVSGQTLADSGRQHGQGAVLADDRRRWDGSGEDAAPQRPASRHRVRSIQLVDAWV